jgi:tetratricopeptide (TPR) repeat protein
MPGKKKKRHHHHTRQLSAPDLLKLAEAELARGDAEAALETMRKAEREFRPRQTADGKKISVPPHIVAAQAAFGPLMARALGRHALAAGPAQQIADLEEAIRHAPRDVRYQVALGAVRLLSDQPEVAQAEFQKADEQQPDSLLATQSFALGLLAIGKVTEASTLLDRQPAERRDPRWRRLWAVCGLSAGSARAQPDSLPEPLLGGLAHWLAGDADRAREQIGALPAFDRNPTRAESAQLATQFYYSGAMNAAAARHRVAFDDWREAARIAQAQAIRLPWRDRLPAHFNYLALAVREQDPLFARECWQETLKLSPRDPAAAANLSATKRAQALQAWQAGQVEQAAGIWREALLDAPPGASDEVLLKNLAIAYEKLDRKDEALDHWRKLARLWGSDLKSRAAEAGFKDRLLQVEQRVVNLMIETDHEPDEVLTELETALKFDPEHVAFRRLAADQLMEMGKAQEALKHLDAIEKASGLSADLLVSRGMAYDQMDRPGDAVKMFEQAMKLEPDNKLVQRNYLIFLGQEASRAKDHGDKKRAIELCRRQLEIDPNYTQGMLQLASLYFGSQKKKEAVELLDRLLAQDPNSALKRVMVGNVYLKSRKFKEAETFFKQALELDAKDVHQLAIGICYWEAKQNRKAMPYFEKAAETGPVEMLLEIAIHLVEGGMKIEARSFLNKAIKRDPTHPMPHLIKGISELEGLSPFSLILFPGLLDSVREELAEAVRLMEGRPEFAAVLPEIRQMLRVIEEGPEALFGGRAGLGGPPGFFFDDDDDDDDDDDFDDDDDIGPIFEFVPPPRHRRRRR